MLSSMLGREHKGLNNLLSWAAPEREPQFNPGIFRENKKKITEY